MCAHKEMIYTQRKKTLAENGMLNQKYRKKQAINKIAKNDALTLRIPQPDTIMPTDKLCEAILSTSSLTKSLGKRKSQ